MKLMELIFIIFISAAPREQGFSFTNCIHRSRKIRSLHDNKMKRGSIRLGSCMKKCNEIMVLKNVVFLKLSMLLIKDDLFRIITNKICIVK